LGNLERKKSIAAGIESGGSGDGSSSSTSSSNYYLVVLLELLLNFKESITITTTSGSRSSSGSRGQVVEPFLVETVHIMTSLVVAVGEVVVVVVVRGYHMPWL